MRKLFLSSGLLIFLIIYLTSCEEFFLSEVTDINLPGARIQLVIYSYISPQDSIIRVMIQNSEPYLNSGKGQTVETAVNVFMARKDGEYQRLAFNEAYKSFIIKSEEFPVEPGFNYKLLVETSTGRKIEAECHVPEMDYEYFKVEVPLREPDEWGNEKLIIDWKLSVRGGNQEKYFTSGAYVKRYRANVHEENPDTLLVSIEDLFLHYGTAHIADISGKTYTYKSSHWMSDYNKRFDSLFVYLLRTDENYYMFHKSYLDYREYGEDNPFSENVLIYSNIKGALGVFAGYNRHDFAVP
jgi:hypothetical protein